ncbi:MAG: histidinol-phosphate transaminase [Burkholderiaceae bacterium]
MTIRAPEYVTQIAPYQAGKPVSELAREYGLDESTIIKLASNENPLGVPETARNAMAQEVSELGRYPDSNGFELKAALAKHYGVKPSQITLGNGSNDLLELATRALVQKGDSVVYSEHAFAVYMLASQAVGARGIVVPAVNYGHNVSAMAAAIQDDTRLIFVANPNNPTGSFIPGEQIHDFLKAVPPSTVVVLDQAYDEYLEPSDRYSPTDWLGEFPNLIVTRTFSKVYGLAGLRIGFGIASEYLTDLMNRVRQPFNTNSIAQAAAIAALGDSEFLKRSYELNLTQRRRLEAAFTRMGLDYMPSKANFVMVNVGDGAGVSEQFLRRGIIVRPVGNYGLPDWIRVSVGLESENTAFLSALAGILNKPDPTA